MPGQFLHTIGDSSQLATSFNGPFLKGHGEARIAMVGRSNVGKSSLINAILTEKLARTSAQPGKTRCVHFYLWKEGKKILADLPGYGFAKTSKDERDRWAKFVNAYLRSDEALERAVVLLDSRHGPTEKDLEAIDFMSFESIPVTFVFTKCDQLKTQSERAKRLKIASAALRNAGFDPEEAHWVSVKDKTGMKRLLADLLTVAPPTEIK